MKEGVLFSESAGSAAQHSTKIHDWQRYAHDQERQDERPDPEWPEQSTDTKERPRLELAHRTTRRKLSWALTLSSQWYLIFYISILFNTFYIYWVYI